MRIKILIISLFIFNGCINQNQKITINSDGSGNMTLKYSTATSNLSVGDEVGGFAFSETKIRNTYTSENTEITNLKIENNEKDSLVSVLIELTFKDFNKLSTTKGFSKSVTEWKQDNDIYRFKYFILKDSINAILPGMENYSFNYEISFPGLVAETNGTRDGNEKVYWEIPVSNFKENVEMNALVETEKKGCGMFGIELPLILAGLLFFQKRKMLI